MFFPFHDDNPTERTPVVTYGIVAINVLAFLWLSYACRRREQQSVVLHRGFIPARIAQLENGKPVLVPQTRSWSVIRSSAARSSSARSRCRPTAARSCCRC